MSGGREGLQAQLEHLQAKYVGTGHADLSKYEWVVNQHRDTYASFLGHPNLLAYFAVAENVPVAVLRRRYFDRIIDPCGPPPPPPSSTK